MSSDEEFGEEGNGNDKPDEKVGRYVREIFLCDLCPCAVLLIECCVHVCVHVILRDDMEVQTTSSTISTTSMPVSGRHTGVTPGRRLVKTLFMCNIVCFLCCLIAGVMHVLCYLHVWGNVGVMPLYEDWRC